MLRKAVAADIPALARVHVASWQETYRGIVPDHYLSSLSYATSKARWRSTFGKSGSSIRANVALDDTGNIIGFCQAGPIRQKEFDYAGEIYAIYLLQQFHGQGFGRSLFASTVRELLTDKISSMLIWVLSDNPTRGFYEAMGGESVAEIPFEFKDVTLPCTSYGWKDLSRFR